MAKTTSKIFGRLSDDDIALITKSVGLSDKLLHRILGGVSVIESRDGESPISLQFGLRVNELLRETKIGLEAREDILTLLSHLVSHYHSACPQVVEWIGRGDFNREKMPKSISIASSKHAVRTVGRLRAKLARALCSLNQVEVDKQH